ncbi:MAG: LUD domain-containing protein [Gammaproteobacteria bacterium]
MKEGMLMLESTLNVNEEFARLATDEQIERAATALEANGIHTIVVENGEAAKKIVLEMIPKGAEVHSGASVTLETLGIKDILEKSGDYDAVRPKIFSMDRKTQADEIRVLGARPAYMLGSVHAVTEDGHVVIASNTGSQLGPYASGAGKVIWVAGTQKIVKDVNEGLRRIQEYVYPLEEVHMQQLYGVGTGVNKILIVNREIRSGHITMILVKEKLGF